LKRRVRQLPMKIYGAISAHDGHHAEMENC